METDTIGYIASALIGILHGGLHGVWCIHSYIPIVTKLKFAIQQPLTQKKYTFPAVKRDQKWFLVSLLGLSSAGAGTASFLAGKIGVASFFIGVFFGFAPPLFLLLTRLMWLLLVVAAILATLLAL